MEDIIKSLKRIVAERPKLAKTNRIPSAVVVPFCLAEEEPQLLFLKKVDSNYPHGGQVCFPGGCFEEGDENLLNTALREFEEETGILKEKVEVLGAMDPVETRSTNYIIYPFIGVLREKPKVNYDRQEIEKAFFVPLSFLLRHHPIPVVDYSYKGILFKTPLIEYNGNIIWGATARILQRILEGILRE